MRRAAHKGHETLTLLELVLQLNGDFRQILEPIRVTPFQPGVLLFLGRHAEARVTDAAPALRVTMSTLVDVVKDLVRKRWVTKRRSVTDTRVVHLRLSQQRGNTFVHRIEQRVHHVTATLAVQDRRVLGIIQKRDERS